MIDCRLRAYTTWPGVVTKDQRNGQFRVDYTTLLDDLNEELLRLDAKDVVLQLCIPETKVRASRRSYDGWPKADARPTRSGVILSFETWKKPLEFQCDTYLDWKDNLRAISLTLTALRAIERYGATRQKQQYRGWEALPPAPTAHSEAMTEMEAAALIVRLAGEGVEDDVMGNPEEFKRVYRIAAVRCHPDRLGSNELMVAVNQAAEVLSRFYGL